LNFPNHGKIWIFTFCSMKCRKLHFRVCKFFLSKFEVFARPEKQFQ
jgi:hypothetical protein